MDAIQFNPFFKLTETEQAELSELNSPATQNNKESIQTTSFAEQSPDEEGIVDFQNIDMKLDDNLKKINK